MKTRIMYIECKSGDGRLSKLVGPARIGRVTFSPSGKTLKYGGLSFRSLKGYGFKSNYYDVETGDKYWISGCHKDGRDALYNTEVNIDEDVREEYWTEIRKKPENVKLKKLRMLGKCC